jgi:3-methyladenine DNA glycosylase/8-oxoguanine DNA glycosylase
MGLECGEGSPERVEFPFPVDLRHLRRRIEGATRLDPGRGLFWASNTPDGPGTLCLRAGEAPGVIVVSAWGEGAAWLRRQVPALVGAHDDRVGDFLPDHPFLRQQLARRIVRFGRTDRVFEALLPTIVGQKVQGKAAARSLRMLSYGLGTPAPGPTDLRLQPAPAVLARLAGWELHRFGLERKRADTIIGAARVVHRLEEAAALGSSVLWQRLVSLRGIGAYTAAIVCGIATGDPDTVPVGDYHLPNWVAYALAGEARADDERMLELLAPYAGHRGRVVDLIEHAGLGAPRYGPRLDIVPIDRLDRAPSWQAGRVTR